MNKKEAIAYAQVALHTLQNSASRDNISLNMLGMEMRSIFKLNDRHQIMIRVAKILGK